MVESKHLARALITEAVVDFRVKARPDFVATEFESLRAELLGSFPKVTQHHLKKMTVTAPDSPSVKTEDLGLQGLFFESEDEKKVAQFRVDGFTFNKLRPYTSWEVIFPQAMKLWKRYLQVANPQEVTRLALRYINRIELPRDLEDISLVMTAAPRVPEDLTLAISGFLSRITAVHQESGLEAIITQLIEPSSEGNSALILDIDTYKEGAFGIDGSAIESVFQELRTFKNQIFFHSLTDQTIERFA